MWVMGASWLVLALLASCAQSAPTVPSAPQTPPRKRARAPQTPPLGRAPQTPPQNRADGKRQYVTPQGNTFFWPATPEKGRDSADARKNKRAAANADCHASRKKPNKRQTTLNFGCVLGRGLGCCGSVTLAIRISQESGRTTWHAGHIEVTWEDAQRR